MLQRHFFVSAWVGVLLVLLSVPSQAQDDLGGLLEFCFVVDYSNGNQETYDLVLDGATSQFASFAGTAVASTFGSENNEALGAYERSTRRMALTSVNPTPDFLCDDVGESLTLTGSVLSATEYTFTLAGNWTNNCLSSGSWTGTAIKDPCTVATAGATQNATSAPSDSYPNPFTTTTTITYDLPERVHATVTVYDALGRRVAVLVDEVQEAGNHTVQWDGRDRAGASLASGSYTYRIEAGSYRETRQVTLVR